MKKANSTKRNVRSLSEAVCAAFVTLVGTAYLLAVPPYGYAGITKWKYGIFLPLFLVFAVLMIEQRLVGGQERLERRQVLDVFPLSLAAYFLFTCISGLVSRYPGTLLGWERREGILTIGLYTAAAVALAWRLEAKKWMLYAFGGAVTLFCLFGSVQLAGANPFLLYPEGMDFYDGGTLYMGQYWSTVGNVNLCAAVLSLAAGAFAAAAVRAGERRDWLCLIPMGLSVFFILELDSEAGMAALLGGFLLMLPFVVTDGEALGNLFFTYGTVLFALAASTAMLFDDGGAAFAPGKGTLLLCAGGAALLAGGALWRRTPLLRRIRPAALRRFWSAFIIAVSAAGVLALYFYDGFGGGFLQQAHELLHGRWDDTFGSNRLFIWRQCWALAGETPWFGGGPDTLGLRGLEGFSRYNEATGSVVAASIDVAHNEYLNILVNQGAFALAAYLTAIGASLVRWWRSPGSRARAIAGAAALFYLIQAFFGISMFLTAPYLWIALAVLNNKKLERKK